MSARLTVEIDPGPLERTRADIAVFFFFDSDRPLQSGAGRVDWRLCGQVSRLLVAGKLSGASGEAVLLQSAGGLAAPLAIGLGLGARNAFDAEACEALGANAARRALHLGARTLALPLPDPHAGDLELSDRIDALVAGVMAAIAEFGADLKLLLVPSQAEVAAVRQAAAALASKPHPPSVALRLEGTGRATDLPAPPGVRESPAGRSQLVK
ncbi:MAG: hypothetical protein JRG90_05140 [Deltaproteobacteria bacterium]|nr:hypothetical protein [Deltaproteobacteria bacterium]